MKYTILKVLSLPIIFLARLTGPLRGSWKRIYYTARLSEKVASMDFSVQCDGHVHVSGSGHVQLGQRCRLGLETELRTLEKGRIRLGNDTRLNRGCTLTSYAGIVVGDFTIIGEYVSIRDANHGMSRAEPMRYQAHTAAPIRIGRDVWIGRGSCILPGVTISDGAVIGANSVVTRDIPPYSIAAGSPARVIKERE